MKRKRLIRALSLAYERAYWKNGGGIASRLIRAEKIRILAKAKLTEAEYLVYLHG